MTDENPAGRQEYDAGFLKELRGHSWSYFEWHAEQRLKVFNFYLLLCTAIAAGFVALAKEDRPFLAGWPLGLIIAVISVVFWRLDVRNRELLNHSEECLKWLEDQMALPDGPNGWPHRCKLFLWDAYDSKHRKTIRLSHRHCFNALFAFIGFGGFGIVIAAAIAAWLN